MDRSCVSDTLTAPLKGRDLDALASYLPPKDYETGDTHLRRRPLAAGSGRRHLRHAHPA